MFQTIIFIIFIVVIAKRIKNFKQDGGMNGNGSMPNTTVTTSPVNNNPVQPQPAQNRPAQAAAQQRTSRTTVRNRPAQAAVQQRSAQAAIQEAKEDGHSTTAYLMEKAEADAREHAKEKFEEQKRLYETRGGLAVAERYLEGDSIPQGKRCVNCGYCGAENLIPMMPRTKYSCYFCREPL